MMKNRQFAVLLAACLVMPGASCLMGWAAAMTTNREADPTTMRGKVMCGYQGWFRCPGDAANMGWIHSNQQQDTR